MGPNGTGTQTLATNRLAATAGTGELSDACEQEEGRGKKTNTHWKIRVRLEATSNKPGEYEIIARLVGRNGRALGPYPEYYFRRTIHTDAVGPELTTEIRYAYVEAMLASRRIRQPGTPEEANQFIEQPPKFPCPPITDITVTVQSSYYLAPDQSGRYISTRPERKPDKQSPRQLVLDLSE